MWDTPALYAVPVLGLALVAWTLVSARRGLGSTPADETLTPVEIAPDAPRPAVVLNPSKFDDHEQAVTTITQLCRTHGWQDPLVIETTKDDPGVSQTKQAIAAGVDLVMACGGDGTVRAVGQALASSGSSVRMGLLPAGTGNLLARNLELPLDDLGAAAEIALTGEDRAIDVGWLSVDDKERQAFLVMAGVGFDAEIMADAPEDLKARVGAAAYVVSGVRKLNGRRERVRMQLDDGQFFTRRVRSVLIGNCGKLQGGIELMPDALIDDGRLDVLILSPSGVVGWAAVAGAISTGSRAGHRTVEHRQGTRLSLHTSNPLTAQLDGDPIGEVRSAKASIEPGALTIRVQPGHSPHGSTTSERPRRVSARTVNQALRSAHSNARGSLRRVQPGATGATDASRTTDAGRTTDQR